MKKSITPFMPDASAVPGGDGMDDRTVLQVARKLAATIGADFFKVIAIHLAKAQPRDADEYKNRLALVGHDVDVAQCLGDPDHCGQADQHDQERA